MAVYSYRALTDAQQNVGGTVAADTPRHARELLRDRGLIVRDLNPLDRPAQHTSRAARSPRTKFRRGTRSQVTNFFLELSTLLDVGMPLLDALDTLAGQSTRRFHASIIRLRDRVAAGTGLAAAMREQPETFDELSINLTEVGEDSGTLDVTLGRLAEFLQKSDGIRDRVGTALIYPAIVTLVGAFSSVFLMTFVVPRIIEPLVEQGLPMPWPTRVVKGASDFALAWWPALLAGGAIFLGAVTFAWRSEKGKRWWHKTVLRLPLIGDMVLKQELLRLAIVLSTLLRSGIVLLRALQIGQRTTRNLVLRNALHEGEQTVLAGGDLTETFRRSGLFPPMATQIFSLGQHSGRLEEMLDRLAASYERQLNAASQRLAAVLEPAIIILLAVGVLFIVLATVLPILEAGNAIQ